jgi:metal-dependent amidase/aminoacylase/carboxypeptidase family protein
MPVVNRIAAYAEEMQGWRRHLHAHPELAFDCHQTAAFVAGRLREFGVDESTKASQRPASSRSSRGRAKAR